MGKHLPAIDGLRAFAVLAVVAYHAGLPVPAGYVGVDVFFVISGYVITRMLLSEPRIDLMAFYARRARRILPALIAVVAVTMALAAALLSADLQLGIARSAVAAMVMLPNLYFQSMTGGYFDAASDEMPLLHLWSLGVEEQFYLLWPLLLVGRRRFAPWLIGGLAVASFALAQWWVDRDSEVAFYQMPARFWELSVGGLLAMAPASRWSVITAPLGAVVLYVAVTMPHPEFPGVGAIPAVLGTGLVLHAIHSGLRLPPLEWKPVRYVGLISYSLYLWHWPLLALRRATTFDQLPMQEGVALCALAFVLAALSYHFIEVPFRRRTMPNLRAVTVGAASCLALAGCAAAFTTIALKDDPSVRLASDFPNNPACHAQRTDEARLPGVECGAGDVVVWGDSHAYAWRPYAEGLGAVYQATRAGCAPSAGNARGNVCDRFNALVVNRAKQGKVVLLSARWLYLFNNPERYTTQTGVASALTALRDVPQVIVMGPIPEMPHPPAKCLAQGRPDLCEVTRAAFDTKAAAARAFLQEEIAKHPNARYVEPADFFCTATTCSLLRGGYSLYWDDDHISASAARGFFCQANPAATACARKRAGDNTDANTSTWSM